MGAAVLLIHHDADIRETGHGVLTAAGHTVYAYTDLDAFVQKRIPLRHDLAILPWHSEANAREGIFALQDAADVGTSRVILLATRAQYASALRALDFGADDCISVPFPVEELLARCNACLNRSAVKPNVERIVAGRLALDKAAHRVVIEGTTVELAPAEFRLLAFFLENQSRVHSRAELLNSAWARKIDAGPRTVDVHVRRLRKSLEPFGCEDMIQTVRGFGYRFICPESSRTLPPRPAGRTLRAPL
jgi:two-component system phosphate regulon response regulator PhoB